VVSFKAWLLSSQSEQLKNHQKALIGLEKNGSPTSFWTCKQADKRNKLIVKVIPGEGGFGSSVPLM